MSEEFLFKSPVGTEEGCLLRCAGEVSSIKQQIEPFEMADQVAS